MEDSTEKFTWNTDRDFLNVNKKLGNVEDSLRCLGIHISKGSSRKIEGKK